MKLKQDCNCNGILLKDIKIGGTPLYCLGQCKECTCYEQNWTTMEVKEINCTTSPKQS